MKRILTHLSKVVLAVAVLVLIVGFGAGVAWAQNPHFLDNFTTTTFASDGDISVHFKESGLGDAVTTYDFHATANIECTCVTKSGNCPKAANKESFSVAVGQLFPIQPENGNVETTLTLEAPGCPTSAQPTCGGGQHFELSSISWLNIDFDDITNGLDLTGVPTSLGPVTSFTCP